MSPTDIDSTTPPSKPPTGLRGLVRRLYGWTIAWSARPSAFLALFGISFAESSVFPIPPDPLVMAMTVAKPRRWLRIAAVCTLGSVLGGMLGYFVGMSLMDVVGDRIVAFYHAEHHRDRLIEIYNGEWGVWFLLVAAFTPIPYKVATITAGMTGMALLPFVLVSIFGRGARFFLVAGILSWQGERVRGFIERYFDLVSLAFVALLVLGFLAIKLVF